MLRANHDFASDSMPYRFMIINRPSASHFEIGRWSFISFAIEPLLMVTYCLLMHQLAGEDYLGIR